jgi:hypothetical protein
MHDGATPICALEARHRTRVLARQLDVRMLVIDEIHSLLAGTYREQRILLNALRFLASAEPLTPASELLGLRSFGAKPARAPTSGCGLHRPLQPDCLCTLAPAAILVLGQRY